MVAKAVERDGNKKHGSSAHILLVDDEEFLVKLWKRILEKHGYRVTSYIEGMLALEDFKSRPESFDLVVTDQSMPVMTGSELVAELFKIRRDIKIIVCTGYWEAVEKEKALNRGICEFLTKPFDNDTLLKAVERNL